MGNGDRHNKFKFFFQREDVGFASVSIKAHFGRFNSSFIFQRLKK